MLCWMIWLRLIGSTMSNRFCADGGAQILSGAVAFGLYDHNVVAIAQRHVAESANGERMWLVRAAQIVVAAGAIERPLLFQNNDRPGIMLADATLAYLRRYAVKLGQRVVVATNNDSAYEVARAFKAAGSDVSLVDSRAHSRSRSHLAQQMRAAGITLLPRAPGSHRRLASHERRGVILTEAVRSRADFVRHIRWLEPQPASLLPQQGPAGMGRGGGRLPAPAQNCRHGCRRCGRRGIWNFHTLLNRRRRRRRQGCAARTRQGPAMDGAIGSATAAVKGKRIWIDLQNDVTVADIEPCRCARILAVEASESATLRLGMRHHQGKTIEHQRPDGSLVPPGAAIIADRHHHIPSVPSCRSPWRPSHGAERGQLQAPIPPAAHRERCIGRRAPYLRDSMAACCGRPGTARTQRVADDVRAARNAAVVSHASSLG